MIPKCLIQRNGKKKNWRQMAVFGGSGGFAAVSSQFLNKHHKSNFYTKAQYCNSFFGWVPALVLMVSKSGTSASPFFISQFLSHLRFFPAVISPVNIEGAERSQGCRCWPGVHEVGVCAQIHGHIDTALVYKKKQCGDFTQIYFRSLKTSATFIFNS